MRYLGNKKSNEFHDLTRQKSQCRIAIIQMGVQSKTFVPDTIVQAIREGFEPCFYCLGTVADLSLVDVGLPLPAAADLRGTDLGGGQVSLRWTHPDDLAVKGIRFDVYSSPDPLDPFRTLRLAQHPSLVATLTGFTSG